MYCVLLLLLIRIGHVGHIPFVSVACITPLFRVKVRIRLGLRLGLGLGTFSVLLGACLLTTSSHTCLLTRSYGSHQQC